MVIVLLVILFTVFWSGLYSNPNVAYPKMETGLRNELLKDYDQSVWPWTEMNRPCLVQTNIMFHKIVDMDLTQGSLRMLVWLRLRWNDPRFTWDPTDWNNITTVHFNQEEFWHPQIEILNSMESTDKTFDPQLAIVGYKGDLFWSRMGQIQISCNMKEKGLTNFPYVTSQCLFEVGSWAYDSSKVYMSRFKTGYKLITHDILKSSLPFALYHINDVHTEFIPYPPFDSLPENSGWTSIQYDVTIHRDLRQDTIGITVSKILLTFISFGAFWLTPSSGERIGFTITIVLAIELVSIQQLSSSSSITLGCFSFALFVVIESIFIAILWQRTDPYCLSPSNMALKRQKKKNPDWAVVIKAVEIEMDRQKTSQNSKSQSCWLTVMGVVLILIGVIGQIFNFNDFLATLVLGVILLMFGIHMFFQRKISPWIASFRQSYQSSGTKFTQQNSGNLQEQSSLQGSDIENVSQNLNTGCSQTTDDFRQLGQQWERQEEATTMEDLLTFPLQNMQQAQAFLNQVLDNKQYEKARISYKFLCEKFAEKKVQTDLFRMMGIFDASVTNFGQSAKTKHNEYWQSLCNQIDKICQFTIIPLFCLFVLFTTLKQI